MNKSRMDLLEKIEEVKELLYSLADEVAAQGEEEANVARVEEVHVSLLLPYGKGDVEVCGGVALSGFVVGIGNNGDSLLVSAPAWATVEVLGGLLEKFDEDGLVAGIAAAVQDRPQLGEKLARRLFSSDGAKARPEEAISLEELRKIMNGELSEAFGHIAKLACRVDALERARRKGEP